MSNSFNISVKPEIAALDDKIDIIDTEVGVIHTSDLPDIDTKIDTIDTEIEVIDGISDAIKLKTDLLPQNPRGRFYCVVQTSATTDFVTLIDVTGHGKIFLLSFRTAGATDKIEVRITLDGIVFALFESAGGTESMNLFPIVGDVTTTPPSIAEFATPEAESNLFNLEFALSLHIELRRSGGTGAPVHLKVNYSLDT